MFTGLVQDCGEVLALARGEDGVTLTLVTRLDPCHLALGASVCCNGVCLTVLESGSSPEFSDRRRVVFFVGPATVSKSRLGELRPKDGVNMEPSLRVGDPLGGHHVSGHVDGCARVQSFGPMADGQAWELVLHLNSEHMDWVVEQGSIAVRGTSLTIARVDRSAAFVSIMLIPHTLAVTNLGALRAGDLVEIECDMQVKAIVQTVHKILPHLVRSGATGTGAP